MKRLFTGLAILSGLLVGPHPAAAADSVNLAGTWVINRAQSQFPREVGFGMDLFPGGAGEASDSEIARGGSGAPSLAPSRSSEQDARNTARLVAEARRPPNWLKIVQTPAVVSVLDDSGRARSFHPTGRDELIGIDGGLVTVNAAWERTGLVVRYRVAPGRELRHTLSRRPETNQLVLETRFVERGGGSSVTRVYDWLPPGASLPAVPPPSQPEPAVGAGARGADPKGDVPASGTPGDVPLGPQKRDAELANITRIGLVVEELTAQAASCGIEKAGLEAAITKGLTDKGLKVAKNADEDTYLYVDVVTVTASAGLCVSRYDASLFTHTTATLSYQSRPSLVRVVLLHEGGIAGGAPKEHADRVLANLTQHVDKFGERIRSAGQ
jgi:hypothetical protein